MKHKIQHLEHNTWLKTTDKGSSSTSTNKQYELLYASKSRHPFSSEFTSLQPQVFKKKQAKHLPTQNKFYTQEQENLESVDSDSHCKHIHEFA